MEDVLINKIINSITEETNLDVEISEPDFKHPKFKQHEFDGMLYLLNGKKINNFYIEYKKNIRIHHIGFFKEIKARNKNFIIITNYLSANVRKELRTLGISYADESGNIFIKNHNVYIFVESKKKNYRGIGEGYKSFNPAGLKVIFNFLLKPSLLNENYRNIAEATNVGLATVSEVLNELINQGYIVKLNNKQRTLINKKDLLEKWIISYGDRLKPKLLIGKYKSVSKNFSNKWRNKKFNYDKTLWSGEPASDIMTNNLKPEVYILYTSEKQSEFIKNYKLIPDINGNMEVYKKFWNISVKEKFKKCVPSFLVYADLLISGNSRNIETAKLIYEEFIKSFIQET